MLRRTRAERRRCVLRARCGREVHGRRRVRLRHHGGSAGREESGMLLK